jgi:lipopolysaccharide biosynthesis regulator YciM
MRLIYTCLAIFAVAGLGYHIGKRVQAKASKAQADAIHKSIGAFCDESAKLRTIIERARAVQDSAKPGTDTVASGPLHFKRGETDAALSTGRLAMLKDYGGKDN